MNCPVCKQDVPLNKAGAYSMHRISDEQRHRWSFCDMSGQPYVPPADAGEAI